MAAAAAPTSAEDALFDHLVTGKIHGMLATLHANERPLRGLAGALDWRFRGEISRALRAGALAGAEGECAYLPIALRAPQGRAQANGHSAKPRLVHLILFGRGSAERSGVRAVPKEANLALLRKNLLSLKLGAIGLSRADFGNPTGDRYFETALKGVPLCLVP